MAQICTGDILTVIKGSMYRGLLCTRMHTHAPYMQHPVHVCILGMVKLRLREIEGFAQGHSRVRAGPQPQLLHPLTHGEISVYTLGGQPGCWGSPSLRFGCDSKSSGRGELPRVSTQCSLTAGASGLWPVDTPRPRALTSGTAMRMRVTGMSKGDSKEEESGPTRESG